MEFKTVNIVIFTIRRTSLFQIMVVVQEITGPVDIIRFVACLCCVTNDFILGIQGKRVLAFSKVLQLGSFCHQLNLCDSCLFIYF